MKTPIKIGVCIMVHNMAPLIPACIKSIQWVDSIFIYDDNSTDGSLDIAIKNSERPVYFEKSLSKEPAFKRGELKVRNEIIDKAFNALGADVLIILDADEMLSEEIKAVIEDAFSDDLIDSMCFSIWHLYDDHRYLHFWETEINSVKLLDPHTRIIKKGKYFTPLFEDGSHPILEATNNTYCVHGPHHFHLKYFFKSTLPNYSLFFLPERVTEDAAQPYLKDLPFELPKDIRSILPQIKWEDMPHYTSTPHYSSHRITYKNPEDALIHPKDKKHE